MMTNFSSICQKGYKDGEKRFSHDLLSHNDIFSSSSKVERVLMSKKIYFSILSYSKYQTVK